MSRIALLLFAAPLIAMGAKFQKGQEVLVTSKMFGTRCIEVMQGPVKNDPGFWMVNVYPEGSDIRMIAEKNIEPVIQSQPKVESMRAPKVKTVPSVRAPKVETVRTPEVARSLRTPGGVKKVREIVGAPVPEGDGAQACEGSNLRNYLIVAVIVAIIAISIRRCTN